MRVFLLIWLSVISISFSSGQQIPIHNYSLTQGLPSSEVYDIFQDSKGFIWFSTDNGVVKYDGYEFKVLNISNGLPDPVVFETTEDKEGKIWFRTFSGRIAYYLDDRIHPYKFNNKLSKACEHYHLVSMAFDSLDNLWFSSFQIIGMIDKDGNLTTKKISNETAYYKTIQNSSIHSWNIQGPLKTQKYVSFNDKVYPFELSHDWEDPKTSHPVKRLLRWNNEFYLSINNNIFKYDGKTLELAYVGDAPIISLSTDNTNNLWVGFFNNGAKRFTKNFETEFDLPVLANYSITKIIQDNENGIWFSTLENGVYHLPNLSITQYELNSTSKIRSAISIMGKILIGETDGTLTIIDNKTNLYKQKKFERGILNLFKTKDIGLISTSRYLFITDTTFSRNSREQRGNFIDFTIDKSGSIWGLETAGISRFDSAGNLEFFIEKRMGQRALLAIDTLLYIGLHTGLKVFDYHLNPILIPEKIKDYKISDLKQINDTTILIATIGNGFLISNLNFKHINHYNSFAKNIYSLISDDTSLWLGSEKGILKFNTDSLIRFKANPRFLRQRNGLALDYINQLSLDENGNVIAYFTNQFSVFKKDEVYFSNTNPKFYIQNLTSNTNEINFNRDITLSHNNNNLQLNFGFISFSNQDISIRYRINNKATWNFTKERQINLYNLNPGVYTPEIQYSTDNSSWHLATLPKIEISKPWWQTYTFQISMVGLMGLIGYTLFKNQKMIYQERTEKMELENKHQKLLIQKEIDTIENERSRIARELHDGIGPNILATKLTVNRILKTNQINNTENIDDKFQLTFKEIKSIIYDLSPPGLERNGLVASIKGYIDWLSKSIETKISITHTGNDITNMRIVLPVFRILQELISNSLKHSGATDIFIELTNNNYLYTVSYSDNGTGFTKKNQNGFGLHNIESRVLSINGELKFTNSTNGVFYTIKIPIEFNESKK